MPRTGLRWWSACLGLWIGQIYTAEPAPALAPLALLYQRHAPAVVGLQCRAKNAQGQDVSAFGTGAVIAPHGLLLTSTTVVPANATEIKVYFTDGRVRAGEEQKRDPSTESVLVKVDAQRLPYLKLARTALYQPGDPVLSWGNPHFTISRDGAVSLSAGSLSGIYQASSADNESRYMGLALETDAAINPGSDGGPITDGEGHLLGIASLAFSRTRWLGLAIPASQIALGLPELEKLEWAPRSASFCAQAPSAQIWAASQKALSAVVAVVAWREGEEEPPARRADWKLKPHSGYSGVLRQLAELSVPRGGAASGLLVAPSGLVLTAAINISDPQIRAAPAGQKKAPSGPTFPKIKKIFIYPASGERHAAEMLGKDASYDLAVLRVAEAQRLPSVELSPAAGLEPGRFVAVLGRSEPPGGVTLNTGLVSARGRYQKTCFQHSALINWGNLGGPVVDREGRVVGLATHLSSRTSWRQNCGVGFALQTETIRELLPVLEAGRKPERPPRPYLGIQGDQGALDVQGARVARVQPHTPAAEAGLEEGDIITAFNDQPVNDYLQLMILLRASKPGDEAVLTVRRDEDTLKLKVTIGQQD